MVSTMHCFKTTGFPMAKREKHVFKDAHACLHAFAAGAVTWGRSSNVFFEREMVYSYGYHFCMGRVLDREKRIILITNRTYSTTTSGHVAGLLGAFSHWTQIECYRPEPGYDAVNVEDYRTRAAAAWAAIPKARTRGPELVREYAGIKAEYKAYCKVMKVRDKYRWFSDTSIQAELERANERARPRIVARERAAVARREALRKQYAEREAERAQDTAEKIARWRRHELKHGLPWDTGTLLRLSIDGRRIETSKGAEVLTVHARTLWNTVQRVRASGVDWTPEHKFMVDHFELTEVGGNGTLVIGCHTIPYDEIVRIAGELGFINDTTEG